MQDMRVPWPPLDAERYIVDPSARPRVVHVITRLIVGGAQRTVIGLADGLADEYDISIVCGPDEGAEGSLRRDAAAVAPVTIVSRLRRDLHPLHDLSAVAALGRTFTRLRPDIIHTHSSKAGIVGRLAAMAHGVPAVHTVHGWGHTPADHALKTKAFVGIERFIASRTEALIAVSEDVRTEGVRLRIGRVDQYRLIPEFVDFQAHLSSFHQGRRMARAALGMGEDEEVVGWVGRFSPQKDPDTLVSSLQQLLLSRPKTSAVLVGDGPLRTRAQAALSSAGLGDRVQFAGLRSDVRRLYCAFDVLLHVSRWEGQPMVVQEAIAERVPVVGTRVTGIGDLVVEGRTGFLVEPGDATGVAARAHQVLDCPNLRAPLDASVVQEVAQTIGSVVSLERHRELYRELAPRDRCGRK